MNLRDFPNFPRFRGKWTDSSVESLDKFLMMLRDYLTKQPNTTIVEVEWRGPDTPSKAVTPQTRPLGVVPLAVEVRGDAGYESTSVAAPIQWVWSVEDGKPTLTFPTLAGLSGDYRLRVEVREAS
jgi:hypothetical protein